MCAATCAEASRTLELFLTIRLLADMENWTPRFFFLRCPCFLFFLFVGLSVSCELW